MDNSQAFGRSEPGTGPTPDYGDTANDLAIKNGWRRDRPAVVENNTETLVQVLAKQIDTTDPYWQPH
jgi:hypothetical protein